MIQATLPKPGIFSVTSPAVSRLLSLDTFRGMTIAGMILVNNPGSWEYVYSPLRHAAWHGITPTDVIFPFFLFIMGVSITFSYSRSRIQTIPTKELVSRIVKRSAILFLLGLFLVSYPHFNVDTFRIPGVLQRIAVVFLVSALLFVFASWRSILYTSLFLSAGYWLAMSFISVPGVGRPNLEVDTNLAAWIDRLFLSGHMRADTQTWDALGLFSTFPALVSGLSGLLIGVLLSGTSSQERKLIWLFVIGCLALLAGWIWDSFFPINKNLWTSSYVVYTTGLACLMLSVLYWFVDVLGYRRWTTFFVTFGMNAITAYVASEFIIKTLGWIKVNTNDGTEHSILSLLYTHVFAPLFSPMNASLAMAIFWVLFFFIPLHFLYRKKIFLKV